MAGCRARSAAASAGIVLVVGWCVEAFGQTPGAMPPPATPIRLDRLPNGPTSAWYVQALGDPAMRGTSSWTGQDARLFLGEHSHLLVRFGTAGPRTAR